MLALGAGAVVMPADALAVPLAFSPCGSAQAFMPTPGVECATLNVPLDRVDPGAGSVSLAVQRIPASGPQLGTIVVLAGGPGQAALPPFEAVIAPLAKLPALRGYELVSFDQRGTGESGALTCPVFEQGSLKCGNVLGAARADYTSQDSVEDLEALRQALGGAPLSLFAVSYGGKVAGMYAREYPEGVSRMVLDSPTPLSSADPLDSQRYRALPRVLDEALCGKGACRSFAPDPYRDLVRLLVSLRKRPLRARVFSGNGRPEMVRITEAGVRRLIGVMDLSPSIAALVPSALASALRGDTAPLARLTNAGGVQGITASLSSPQAFASFGVGAAGLGWESTSILASKKGPSPEESASKLLSLELLLATRCVESQLPWSPESLISTRTAALRAWMAHLPAGIASPFTLTRAVDGSLAELCLEWPPTPSAPPPPTGTSSTPTLILSGDEDLRTPYEQDLTIASEYSNVQILRIPGAGHSTTTSDRTGCARNAMIAFLAGGSVPSSCPNPTQPLALPPPPSSLNDVRPTGTGRSLAARGANAVAQTIQEILGQPSPVGGGLHGGFYREHDARLEFHHLVDIPGVSISGSLSLKSPMGRLAVSGRVRGALRLRGTMLVGRLNGIGARASLVG